MTLNLGLQRTLVSLLGTAAMLCACRPSEPTPQATDAKSQIRVQLAKKTGQKQFTPGIDLGLASRVARLQTNSAALEQRAAAIRAELRTNDTPEARVILERQLHQTEGDWESVRSEVARLGNELSHQEDNYIRSVREQMKQVGSYNTLYRLIGEQLATADQLLAEPDPARRRMGLNIAREACKHAMSDSVDTWLAARICEAYFWPNLDIADAKPGSHERALDLLQTARRVLFDGTETNHVFTNYHLLLAHAPNAHDADTYRVQLADWLEEKGDLKRAHEVLGEIRDAQVLASSSERITRVKQRATGTP